MDEDMPDQFFGESKSASKSCTPACAMAAITHACMPASSCQVQLSKLMKKTTLWPTHWDSSSTKSKAPLGGLEPYRMFEHWCAQPQWSSVLHNIFFAEDVCGNEHSCFYLCMHCSPHVSFCGYSMPHPSEEVVNLRVQTTGEFSFCNWRSVGTKLIKTSLKLHAPFAGQPMRIK